MTSCFKKLVQAQLVFRNGNVYQNNFILLLKLAGCFILHHNFSVCFYTNLTFSMVFDVVIVTKICQTVCQILKKDDRNILNGCY